MNLKERNEAVAGSLWERRAWRGTVTGTDGNKVFVRRSPKDPIEGPYPRLVSYTSPTAADEVLVIWVGGYLVVGKVVR